MTVRRIVAILLMTVWFAWNAGVNAQPFDNLVVGIGAFAAHVVPLAVLGVLAAPLLLSQRMLPRQWQAVGITVLAILALLLFDAFVVVFSIMNPQASFGLHSVNDAIPGGILAVGALMWLAAFDWRRANRPALDTTPGLSSPHSRMTAQSVPGPGGATGSAPDPAPSFSER